MEPLAHHAGEQSPLQLVLLGSGALPLVMAIGRARVAAARARLAGRRRPHTAAKPPGPDRR